MIKEAHGELEPENGHSSHFPLREWRCYVCDEGLTLTLTLTLIEWRCYVCDESGEANLMDLDSRLREHALDRRKDEDPTEAERIEWVADAVERAFTLGPKDWLESLTLTLTLALALTLTLTLRTG